jgi:hypothetical protein
MNRAETPRSFAESNTSNAGSATPKNGRKVGHSRLTGRYLETFQQALDEGALT